MQGNFIASVKSIGAKGDFFSALPTVVGRSCAVSEQHSASLPCRMRKYHQINKLRKLIMKLDQLKRAGQTRIARLHRADIVESEFALGEYPFRSGRSEESAQAE